MKCAGLNCNTVLRHYNHVFIEEEDFQKSMTGIKTPERIYCHKCFPKGYVCGTHYDRAYNTKAWKRMHPKLKFKTEQSPEANVIQSDSGRDILMFITFRSQLNLINCYGNQPIKPIKIGIRRAA